MAAMEVTDYADRRPLHGKNGCHVPIFRPKWLPR